MSNSDDLSRAESLAIVAHGGQKYGNIGRDGHPYYLYKVRDVVSRVRDMDDANADDVVVAYLQATLEDTDVTTAMLEQFGFSRYVSDAVVALTRRKGVAYAQYIHELVNRGNESALRVKLADLEFNLKESQASGMTPRVMRYTEARILVRRALKTFEEKL